MRTYTIATLDITSPPSYSTDLTKFEERTENATCLLSDAIYGVVVDRTGVKIRNKLGDSKTNRSKDSRRLPYFVRTTTPEADEPYNKHYGKTPLKK